MKAAAAGSIVRAIRGVAAVAGLLLLVPRPQTAAPASLREPSTSAARVLILSDQARRFLALQSRSSRLEFMGCMIGKVHGRSVRVDRIAPADVAPSEAGATWVRPTQTCEQAGWTGTVGLIHSHPTAERCWYHFPTTSVWTSDGQSFLRHSYPVDAILCGTRVVWISRDMTERQVLLVDDRTENGAGATAPAADGARASR